jgi:hypothetical protein
MYTHPAEQHEMDLRICRLMIDIDGEGYVQQQRGRRYLTAISQLSSRY